MTFVCMIIVLVGVALLLPNTLCTGNGSFNSPQATIISILMLIGYGGLPFYR